MDLFLVRLSRRCSSLPGIFFQNPRLRRVLRQRRLARSLQFSSRSVIRMSKRYLEDFAVGQTFISGRWRITKEQIKAFANEFDPQPFHLDETAAHDTFFQGLAASGWHTAALTMRLLVESELQPAGGVIGAGFDEFHWPKPVRPGDELRTESEVLEVRPSRSKPSQGLIKLRTTTLNQNDEAVQVQVGNLIVSRRQRHGV